MNHKFLIEQRTIFDDEFTYDGYPMKFDAVEFDVKFTEKEFNITVSYVSFGMAPIYELVGVIHDDIVHLNSLMSYGIIRSLSPTVVDEFIKQVRQRNLDLNTLLISATRKPN